MLIGGLKPQEPIVTQVSDDDDDDVVVTSPPSGAGKVQKYSYSFGKYLTSF